MYSIKRRGERLKRVQTLKGLPILQCVRYLVASNSAGVSKRRRTWAESEQAERGRRLVDETPCLLWPCRRRSHRDGPFPRYNDWLKTIASFLRTAPSLFPSLYTSPSSCLWVMMTVQWQSNAITHKKPRRGRDEDRERRAVKNHRQRSLHIWRGIHFLFGVWLKYIFLSI